MNTAHAWQLGWLAPQLLDASQLAPAQTRSLVLKSQSRTKFSGLKVNVSSWANNSAPVFVGYRWAAPGGAGLKGRTAPGAPANSGGVQRRRRPPRRPLPPPRPPTETRARLPHAPRRRLGEGPDQYLDPGAKDRVVLYTYTGRDNHSPEYSFILASLKTGQSFTYDAGRLAIKVVATSPAAGEAALLICRKADAGGETRETCLQGLDGDCDWLTGAGDPDCRPFLPK